MVGETTWEDMGRSKVITTCYNNGFEGELIKFMNFSQSTRME